MTDPTTKPTALRLTDTDTIRRLAALAPSERAEMRVVMKEQPDPRLPYHSPYENWHDGKRGVAFRDTKKLGVGSKVQILVHPFGAPGTRLWVRETYRLGTCKDRVSRYLQFKVDMSVWCVGHMDGIYTTDGRVDEEIVSPSRWYSPVTLGRKMSRIHLTTIDCRRDQDNGVWVWLATVQRVES